MGNGDPTPRRIAILGGTGAQGRGLATRFAAAGVPVVLGSRDVARAEEAAAATSRLAAALTRTVPAADDRTVTPAEVTGGTNVAAVAGSDIVVVAVPWAAHADTLTELAPALRGRIVVDCVNPLGFDQRGPFSLPVAEGSAAEQAVRLLPESTVVAAFHHVSAVLLLDPEVHRVETDVLVLGDDRAATDRVIELAASVPGMRGVYAGRLRNAGQVEALTANLIAVNRRYRAHAGVRVTDV